MKKVFIIFFLILKLAFSNAEVNKLCLFILNENKNMSKEIYSNFKIYTYSEGKLTQVEQKIYKKKAIYFLNFSNLDTIVFELDNKKYEVSNPLKYFISETIEIDLIKFSTSNNCMKINYNIDDDLNFASFFIPYKCNEYSIIKFSNSELYSNFYKNKRLVKKYFIFYEFVYKKSHFSIRHLNNPPSPKLSQ